MNLNPNSTTYSKPEDHSWLRSKADTEFGVSITLDATKFGSTPFPGLIVRSGTLLGKVTASGKYGPYKSDASDGTQTPIGFLLATIDLTQGGLVVAGADSPASLLWRGAIVAAKVPQGTGASSTTPGAIDTATGPALTTLTGSAPYTLPTALIEFRARFLFT
ncbi:head decoration protein [Frankia sp. AvcI1]|uniref:head decoration protein n=1 Tax=Frankia sp. AvcI1 TaxID=573496 RepID=UPI00211888E3|nr:head decoration protein [Frankia sp. AvcI1]